MLSVDALCFITLTICLCAAAFCCWMWMVPTDFAYLYTSFALMINLCEEENLCWWSSLALFFYPFLPFSQMCGKGLTSFPLVLLPSQADNEIKRGEEHWDIKKFPFVPKVHTNFPNFEFIGRDGADLCLFTSTWFIC